MKILELEEIDSTNDYCKRIDCGEDIIVTAHKQTAGKGTKGRSFVSEDGGLYVSVMRHFAETESVETFKIMISACVAVCHTLESFGLKPVIRWANDVLVDGKKICGTLIENTFFGSKITRSIVGIGLNVNNELPEELSEIATSIRRVTKTSISVREVRNLLIKNLQNDYDISDYKKYINWFGQKVLLKRSDGEYSATALDVDNEGRLVCEADGKIQYISSAEVSLKI